MKIFCIGRNYINHAKELNNPIPKKPLVFMKPPTALLKNNRDFYHPEFSDDIHYETEIVVKIAKNGKHIQTQFAKNYYKEIGLGIDFTARDLQSELKQKGHPWEIAKGFDHSAVIGQFIPKEELNKDIVFSLLKNGEKVQEGNTKDMLFSIDDIISYISKYFMLQTGDLVYTGTPAGVGKIEIGDVFEGFIGEKMLFSTKIK